MKLATQIFLGFLIAISIDLLDSYVNYTLTLKVNTNTDFLVNSENIIRNSGALNKGMLDMQSAFRGYLLTADEYFLSSYYQGIDSLPALIKQQKSLIAQPTQQQKLDSIVHLHNLWINYANQLIQTKKEAAVNPVAASHYRYLFDTQFKKQVGKSYNDQIAALFNEFDQYEYKVREERRAALARSIKHTERSSLIFSSLIIIISIGIAWYLVAKISRRIHALVTLADNIAKGNFAMVEDNTKDELNSLSVSLNAMSLRLSQNITELTKKNEELNQFAYVVSHDLKAPIRGIANVVQWIKEDLANELSPAMWKYLDIIPERIKRMENLIDGLLQYARLDNSKSLKEEVDVALMIKEITEVIVPKEYELNTNNLPRLYTEKLLLEQVFSNLISNAVKYTPAGNGKITISCMEKTNLYEFTVTDNGPGIKPEYHEKIFVIFQTLREKNDKESTGVGLAIVKKIIEYKHCTVRVVSEEGKGTSFIFTWPKNEV